MADITQRLSIACTPEVLYRAILDHGSNWWTTDTEIDRSETRFSFEGRSVVFRMKPERLEPARRIEWKCVGDQPEWTGTRLVFAIAPGENDGESTLRMTHADWKGATDYFANCGYAWAHVLDRLKEFAETGKPVPFFTT